jgi:hypothetical protein
MSRVDFSRIYTIEHNVKVFDFGMVHHTHVARLRAQWMGVITEGVTGAHSSLLNIVEENTKAEDGDDEDKDKNYDGINGAAGGSYG